MTIQNYFPLFHFSSFNNWLQSDFLPYLLSAFLKGDSFKLKRVAQSQIVYERQLIIADIVNKGQRVKSKLIDVNDIEILEMKFSNLVPAIDVRCFADYTEFITDSKGQIVEGHENEIKRSEFMIVMSLDTEGDSPVWKAKEFRIGLTNSRI